MKKIVGIGLIAVGIVGLILPLCPGWLLIFAGAALLRSQKKQISTAG